MDVIAIPSTKIDAAITNPVLPAIVNLRSFFIETGFRGLYLFFYPNWIQIPFLKVYRE
jgi:hypothetical protein